jgi:hypothetical protein
LTKEKKKCMKVGPSNAECWGIREPVVEPEAPDGVPHLAAQLLEGLPNNERPQLIFVMMLGLIAYGRSGAVLLINESRLVVKGKPFRISPTMREGKSRSLSTSTDILVEIRQP